jgi:hypothetical protein
MTKKKKAEDERDQDDAKTRASLPVAGEGVAARRSAKMKRKKYEAQLRLQQGELVAMQEWVKDTGAKICIVFEGRDTAGKAARSSGLPNGSARAYSGWWRCLPRPGGKRLRCMSSATSSISGRPARS